MAGKNLLQLRTSVLERLPTPPGLFSTDMLNRFINLGEADVAIKTLSIENVVTAQTAAGSRTVSTPYVKVLGVEYVPATGRPKGLPKMIPLQLGHVDNSGLTTPQFWFPWGKVICIEPKPTAVNNLNLYVATLPTDRMSNDSHTPQVPAKLHDKITSFARIRCLLRLGQFSAAAVEYADYIYDLEAVRTAVIKKYTQLISDTRTPEAVRVLERAV